MLEEKEIKVVLLLTQQVMQEVTEKEDIMEEETVKKVVLDLL